MATQSTTDTIQIEPEPIVLRPMTPQAQERAAAKFAAEWQKLIDAGEVTSRRGNERSFSQTFWTDLLEHVLGVENPKFHIAFEDPVESDTTSFADGYIARTRVLIEQKSSTKDLDEKITQSDGTELTAYQQAQRYIPNMPLSKHPRWVVTCNFKEFRIHDMEHPNEAPESIALEDLGTMIHRLRFLTDDRHMQFSADRKKEIAASEQAGVIVGNIYKALLEECRRRGPVDADLMHSLNVLCVRLVFCLYAESAGIFGRYGMFREYMHNHQKDARTALINLFKVLDTPVLERERFLDEDLAEFPYVNGGLFRDTIEMPPITPEIAYTIFYGTDEGFNWRDISPTIFGAIFESTLNPETQHQNGMHYTSISNIRKVIGPLFLDDLEAELDGILGKYDEDYEKSIRGASSTRAREERRQTPVRNRNKALREFREKLASLKFFDPACGSGNFLTETYLQLRRLENKAIRHSLRFSDGVQMGLAAANANPIKVSIEQFFGIEINDFAVAVAQTALWIAEAQMLRETEEIINNDIEFLPLTTTGHIVTGNALRMDWEDVVPSSQVSYCYGNPPFLGFTYMSAEQKRDMESIFGKVRNLDYVCAWYRKALDYAGPTTECAFVSTNSITQGETAARFWPFMNGAHLNFAHTTFAWDNEAVHQAHVHVVVIGFGKRAREVKVLYTAGHAQVVNNINYYLQNAPSRLIKSRTRPLCQVEAMVYGNKFADGGSLILNENERDALLKEDPDAATYVHELIGAAEFINNKHRWCLWLDGISPSELRKHPKIMERVQACKKMRQGSVAKAIQKFAETPWLAAQRTQPENKPCLVIPCVSSEQRRYVPMGFIQPGVIVTNLVQIVPEASMYTFGMLTSSVHMAWMRAFAGRLKSDYRYSKDIVYNNFPWPDPTPKHKARIEETAQAILDARALYPDSSLADLYDEATMPQELRQAHNANDKAVMAAYGFTGTETEPEIVARLMQMYADLSANAD